MKYFLFLFLSLSIYEQTGYDEAAVKKFQHELEAKFRDPVKSPLTKADMQHFSGLEFFTPDEAYFVKARLVRTEDEKPFRMKTTTGKLPMYSKYGELYFTLNGKDCKLNIYKNIELTKKAAYKNHLFLPFSDPTNTKESYSGGRFIDMEIQEGDTMTIDFNKAYNPYCAYNDKYSCPIVPAENFIDVEIRAGVKKFHD